LRLRAPCRPQVSVAHLQPRVRALQLRVGTRWLGVTALRLARMAPRDVLYGALAIPIAVRSRAYAPDDVAEGELEIRVRS
jgi:hypothetical protein